MARGIRDAALDEYMSPAWCEGQKSSQGLVQTDWMQGHTGEQICLSRLLMYCTLRAYIVVIVSLDDCVQRIISPLTG